ncbi:MAG: hypothetical protein AAF639_10835 [Chloroflexota bacterium]
MTVLDGCYRVSPENTLSARTDGRMVGLNEGVATVELATHGLKATRHYHVLSGLSDDVQLHLIAHVPEGTPDVEKIYYGLLELERTMINQYEGHYTLPRGFALADLFSWGMRKFESRVDGTPMPRRLLRVDDDCTIEYTIARWST